MKFFPIERKELYQQAVQTFGPELQFRKVTEELCELAVAVSHWQDNRIIKRELISEIADVQIMLEQLKVLAWISEESIQKQVDIKLARLQERIQQQEAT